MGKIYIIILVFSIFANVYSIPSIGIGYGEMLILPLLPFLLVDFIKNKKARITNATFLFKGFLIYTLLVTFVNMILINEVDDFETIKRLIRCYFYFFLFCFFSKYYFEYEEAKKFFTLFSVLLSIFIIIQFVSFNVFGYYISGLIPGLSIDTETREDLSLVGAESMGYMRPRGFLGEPAHCAQTLSLSLLLELFPYHGEKINKKCITLYIIALFLSVSANAYASLVVIGAMWFWNKMKTSSFEVNKLKIVVACAIIIMVIVANVDKILFLSDVYERFSTLNEATDNSAGLRLLRGPAFFARMEPISQLFGIGLGNFLGYREHFHIWTIHEEPDEYMSSASGYLVGVGLLGILILILCIISAMHKKPFKNKAIMILIVVLSLSSSVAYSPIWVLFLSFSLWGYRSLELKTVK